jgi:hypothetical protein
MKRREELISACLSWKSKLLHWLTFREQEGDLSEQRGTFHSNSMPRTAFRREKGKTRSSQSIAHTGLETISSSRRRQWPPWVFEQPLRGPGTRHCGCFKASVLKFTTHTCHLPFPSEFQHGVVMQWWYFPRRNACPEATDGPDFLLVSSLCWFDSVQPTCK